MTEQLSGELPTNQSSTGQGPGARLRKAREDKHFSLDEMAKQMRFTRQRLIQLENDDYRTMGSRTFAHGYLRNYGRLLHMTEDQIAELLKLFDSLHLEDNIRINKPQLIHEKIVHTSPKATRRLGYLVVIIALIFVGFWWHSHSSSEAKLVEGRPGVSPIDANNNSSIPEQQVTAGVSSTADKANLQTLSVQPQTTAPAANVSTGPASTTTAPTATNTSPAPASVAAPSNRSAVPVVSNNTATDAAKAPHRQGSSERARLIRE